MTQETALKILKTGVNVFLTGEPGSGKTYTINRHVQYLRSHGIEPAITASTGIAATHIGGMTIHSWSGIGIKDRLSKAELRKITDNDYVVKRVESAKVLIIDEISMLPPGNLQMVDAVCRAVKNNSKPFGGIQVVLVGDFFQLPPVVKNYSDNSDQNLFDDKHPRFAYDSEVWQQSEFIVCYLTEQYRQDDANLVSVLKKIRKNNFDDLALEIIGARKIGVEKIPLKIPKLFSHNFDVDEKNNQMLARISNKSKSFQMKTKGNPNLVAAMKKGCLSPEKLYLKVGAAVMFTKNNSKEGFVNGTLGEVVGFSHDNGLPIVKIRSGRKITAGPMEWSVEENGIIKASLLQIPLRLAWAITVHKSQGVSLDEAVIDLSRVFEFGQGYVAISRVRRLSGIYILGWNDLAFQVNPEVLEVDDKFRIESENAEKMFRDFPENEIKKKYDNFILYAGGEIKAVDVFDRKKKQKSSTYDETLALWKEGKNLFQISEIRGLVENTILGHLEKLVDEKRIERPELLKIVPENFLPDLAEIMLAFKKFGTDSLSPTFHHFSGKYSYDELRMARIVLG